MAAEPKVKKAPKPKRFTRAQWEQFTRQPGLEVSNREMATRIGETPGALWYRLHDDLALLKDEYRVLFKDYVPDLANKRLLTRCGRYAFTYEVGERPLRCGHVYLVRLAQVEG